MRKPSEIIALAASDSRYDPTFTGHSHKHIHFLCNMLEDLRSTQIITDKECSMGTIVIREALEGHVTLATLLVCRLGKFEYPRVQYMHFWDQLIQKLQSQGR